MSETDPSTVEQSPEPKSDPAVHVEQTPPEPAKKKRRPYWLLIPITGTQTFQVHRCVGQPAVRKLLETMEIDATDERISGIKLLRADEVPINWEKQVVIKFGKATDEDEDESGTS